MDSLKFMLDLDTGKTMDPPATIRLSRSKWTCRQTGAAYHYPTKLTFAGCKGWRKRATGMLRLLGPLPNGQAWRQ
jgi:hypothetical protein